MTSEFEKAKEAFGEFIADQFMEYLKEKHPELKEDIDKFTLELQKEEVPLDSAYIDHFNNHKETKYSNCKYCEAED